MIHHGNLFDVLPTLPDASIDACVTDPPYGIGFMGREWDTFKPGTGATRKLMHPREREAAKIVSDNPNIDGRHRSPALSPSQIDYDYSTAGLRRFQEWCEQWGREVFRVLKPGGYILSCGAPRAYHRMASGLEDAGFEVRDCLAWIFGSGFPKSLNIGCRCETKSPTKHFVRRVPEADLPSEVQPGSAADEVLLEGLQESNLSLAEGTERREGPQRPEESGMEGRRHVQAEQGQLHRPEVRPVPAGVLGDGEVGRLCDGAPPDCGEADRTVSVPVGSGASPGSQHAEQRGREPGTVRQQRPSQARGSSASEGVCPDCGGLIDFRGWGTALKPAHEPIVLARKPFKGSVKANVAQHGTGALNIDACRIGDSRPAMATVSEGHPRDFLRAQGRTNVGTVDEGRWPANVCLDDIASMVLDEQSGELVSGGYPQARNTDKFRNVYGSFKGGEVNPDGIGANVGGASRFYYVAKPSREERDMGCYDLPARSGGEATDRKDGSAGLQNPRAGAGRNGGARNIHPTVKPVELMRWLVRLVTPPGGTVLDPFTGSGTTGMACVYEQRQFIGIEREAEYVEIARRRIAAVAPLFSETAVEEATSAPARVQSDEPAPGERLRG